VEKRGKTEAYCDCREKTKKTKMEKVRKEPVRGNQRGRGKKRRRQREFAKFTENCEKLFSKRITGPK